VANAAQTNNSPGTKIAVVSFVKRYLGPYQQNKVHLGFGMQNLQNEIWAYQTYALESRGPNGKNTFFKVLLATARFSTNVLIYVFLPHLRKTCLSLQYTQLRKNNFNSGLFFYKAKP